MGHRSSSIRKPLLTISFLVTGIGLSTSVFAQLTEALTNGNVSGNFNLRFESVKQDNNLNDAQALTLSSRLSYSTGSVGGFSALVEMEDVSVVAGVDNYTVGPGGFKTGEFSVIADPETTEVDQAFVQYSDQKLTTRLGRQQMIFDNHRFVGNVGWRQDRQSFDGLSLDYKASENLRLNYNYIADRRRIFAEDADVDSDDSLFRASFTTAFGNFTGYAYLLESDDTLEDSLDTFGVRYRSSNSVAEVNINTVLEYARQKFKTAAVEYSADYILIEAGLDFKGINVKAGYEILGSDDGNYGFTTPLATLHAFNGWADLFLNTPDQGLSDLYINVGGSALGGNWSMIYHDFSAEDSTSTLDNFGNELDLQYVYPVSANYSVGIKYAMYSAGDGLTGRPETDRFWLWLNARF